ncbi:hypothetical protein HAD_06025 [Hyphomonas adhaerens MHS-3]|uniref:Lipoprotein n=1 Tax=Hyphomonas adhaerens MHS-3 TaxID=1280949 RepID=A0A069E940_9PROT|nr:hypothetical protein [Hyphomonas adhaerens]KCZ85216.1 hypothetical protein HAD_06025 [Hyphomonas adhaerens MHS-3]
MSNKFLHKASLSIASVFVLSACASTGLPPMSLDVGVFGKPVDVAVKVTASATQVQGWCFAPPQRRDFTGLMAEGAYLLEMQNYNRNVSKYDVCSLRTPAKQLVAAAELSKFTLVAIADTLAETAKAQALKSDSINEIAERLKVTPAYDLDFEAESKNLSAEIAKLQSAKSALGETVTLTPEAYKQIAIAQAKLDAAASYMGQMLGTSIVVGKSVYQMTENERQVVFRDAAATYKTDVPEDAFAGFFSDVGNIAQGTIAGASGLTKAAINLGAVEKPEDVKILESELESAVTLTNAEAKNIIKQIDDGSL